MLIVVGIIGILVALAVPALSTAMSDARQAKVSAYVSQINTALNRYVIAQETANSQVAITTLSTGWDKIKEYLVINGTTGPSYNDFQKAVCNGGSATVTGARYRGKTTLRRLRVFRLLHVAQRLRLNRNHKWLITKAFCGTPFLCTQKNRTRIILARFTLFYAGYSKFSCRFCFNLAISSGTKWQLYRPPDFMTRYFCARL